jgi:hypothetical protein
MRDTRMIRAATVIIAMLFLVVTLIVAALLAPPQVLAPASLSLPAATAGPSATFDFERAWERANSPFERAWAKANSSFDRAWLAAATRPVGTIDLTKPHTFSATFAALVDSPVAPIATQLLAGPATSIVWTNPQSWSDRFGFVLVGDQLRLVEPDPTAMLGDRVLVASIGMQAGHAYRVDATATARSRSQMDVRWTLTDLGNVRLGVSAPVAVATGIMSGVPAFGQLRDAPQEIGVGPAWLPLWSDAR